MKSGINGLNVVSELSNRVAAPSSGNSPVERVCLLGAFKVCPGGRTHLDRPKTQNIHICRIYLLWFSNLDPSNVHEKACISISKHKGGLNPSLSF